jgi:hypothetical protein
LREGFRRSRSCNYTGTGICLSESITIAYEYGMYETGGCVLEARISPTARWTDEPIRIAAAGEAWDQYFIRSGMDAVRTFGGNTWIVRTPGALVSVRRLTHRQAIQKLCAEFEEEGPEVGYNGGVSDYASIWWRQDAGNPGLTRFPEYHRQLKARLKRFVGRAHSARA